MFEANGFIVLVSMYHTIRFSSLLLHFCKKKIVSCPRHYVFTNFPHQKGDQKFHPQTLSGHMVLLTIVTLFIRCLLKLFLQ